MTGGSLLMASGSVLVKGVRVLTTGGIFSYISQRETPTCLPQRNLRDNPTRRQHTHSFHQHTPNRHQQTSTRHQHPPTCHQHTCTVPSPQCPAILHEDLCSKPARHHVRPLAQSSWDRYRGTLPIRKRPPPENPRHRPTVGSYGGAFSCKRGTPAVK